jgi:hypothetical protein
LYTKSGQDLINISVLNQGYLVFTSIVYNLYTQEVLAWAQILDIKVIGQVKLQFYKLFTLRSDNQEVINVGYDDELYGWASIDTLVRIEGFKTKLLELGTELLLLETWRLLQSVEYSVQLQSNRTARDCLI